MISPASFALAYALDWLIGDPLWLPHPVRWMGRMISGAEWLQRRFTRTPSSEFVAGLSLAIIVLGTFGFGSSLLLLWLRGVNPTLAFLVSLYLAASTLATRSLLDEARAVRCFLASFIPARVTALLFVCAAWTLHLDWLGAWRIMRRDGAKHKSPNAGRPEAAMAGALGVRLGGTNFYEGEAHDGQHLGDAHGPLDDQALRNALWLTSCVSIVMFSFCLSASLLIHHWYL